MTSFSWVGEAQAPDDREIDVAERKGRGHPDTLADAVADHFALEYERACTEQFGAPLNGWVDKITLVGASSRVGFGGFQVHEGIHALLIGKLARGLGDEIDVLSLFERSTTEVFVNHLGDPGVLSHCDYQVFNTAGSGVDHADAFYSPASAASAVTEGSEPHSNDSVVCVASSAPGLCGRLALGFEDAARASDPRIGTDIKVMIVRRDRDLEVTAAVPVHPEQVSSRAEYLAAIAMVRERTLAWLQLQAPHANIDLRLNTRDGDAGAYLAPFGTSLGKGDVGAVGRGNRRNGLIEPFSIWSAEAPAGKNRRSHGGAVFTRVAAAVARDVAVDLGRYVEVLILARAGDLMVKPSQVVLRSTAPWSPAEQDRSRVIAVQALETETSGGAGQ